ncbi:MAG: bifunctional indole-3-glycerol-phosphate synthase TrpC/phosphoribosylanthranilate isomerase TrpF [Pirellulaceae bacterium]|nr:bifunctional indole-3-glycerol-phosphate synthase TrpC/phosphoribosylanthranilate isomerase TrpF [Pirellulaceae bacterium]
MSKITILDEIVQAKRVQLADQVEAMPLESFRSQLTPSKRDFAASLKSSRPGFILECKKASPSRGLIRTDFDLVSIARTYGEFASAISVLTETNYFQGSSANLGIVKQNATQPLLCKDFLVEPYQVFQARYFGADAVLLILAILSDAQWSELSQLASTLGMDVLTEVSNREEQQRAIRLGARIVGINNRDLRDMSVNLDTTSVLAAELPSDTLVVSESGYANNAQARRMAAHADAFLIGSSLMAESDLTAAVKGMIFGKCKVCGLTARDDAMVAARAGATYGGVVLAEGSPRCIPRQDINAIFDGVPLLRVGVFQDQSSDFIIEVANESRLDVVQLHGDESPAFVFELLGRGEVGFEAWKALPVGQLQEDAEKWFAAGVSNLLVDNQTAHQKGGTGSVFDWSLLPDGYRDRIILAGGINPDNVGQAMALGCAGVDMNSGVEVSPGKKSQEKIEAAFRAIRDY